MEQVWINDALVFASAGATIVAGVIVLWLFFDLRGWFKRRRLEKNGLLIKKLPVLSADGVLRVRLKEGKTYDGLRLAGVMSQDAARDAGLPHPLTNLVCFEREDGTRVWLDASAIRVIETLREEGE